MGNITEGALIIFIIGLNLDQYETCSNTDIQINNVFEI